MAVFWFGWAKKLKNVFTKKEADNLYLPKTFEATINEVKRLTNLITIKNNNTMPGNGSLQFRLNPQVDITRPIYIGFEKWDNGSNTLLGAYTIVSILDNDATPKIYNNINDITVYMYRPNSGLQISGKNFQSNIVFKNFTIQYTPKTLITTINETQEEGE